jgi:hypothetical protein
MIQFKLNGCETCRKMALDIALAYEQSDYVPAPVLNSDHNGPPLLSPRQKERTRKMPSINWQRGPQSRDDLVRQGMTVESVVLVLFSVM